MHDITSPQPPDLSKWIFVKQRGALVRDIAAVYRSPDSSRWLRTGKRDELEKETSFLKDAARRGFPIPRLLEEGDLADGTPYFIESSVGSQPFAHSLAADHSASNAISPELFEEYTQSALRFLEAQLHPDNHQTGSRNLYQAIQLDNIHQENPEIPDGYIEAALDKAAERTAALPLVITHGDFNPFNILPGGIVDFELRFTGPAGYDAITCITFHRIWDHPQPDGTGTMRMWEFSKAQIASYLERVDALCVQHGIPRISQFFDDFLMLKAVWALSYEHPAGREPSQVHRWNWRKRVALYAIERYMADQPIESESFYRIGLGLPKE